MIESNGDKLAGAALAGAVEPAQFPAVILLSDLDGSNGFRIDGETVDDVSGRAVASAGDFNGDGFADILIGAYGADPHGLSSGASYIIFGKAEGFNASLSLSSLNGVNGFQISGEAGGDVSGKAVATAGDVNGDGFADVIIGAYGADPHGSASGAAYVVFGKASGFTSNLDLSALTGSDGFKINGVSAFDGAGYSVSSAGDVNGDGIGDVIIGARYADPHGSSSGAAYVVFGKTSPFAAAIDLSSLDGANGFKLSGAVAVDDAGQSVASAGDVNGDGIDDIIVGAHGADPHGQASGTTYVVFGKLSGFDADTNLDSLNGLNGFKLNGGAALDYSGRSVSSAGDVNGDGVADMLVGACAADPHGSASGAAYVVFGKTTGFSSTFDLDGVNGVDGFKLSGVAAGDYAGISVAAAGDVNGDGFDDVIVGAFAADPHGSKSGASYVVFGKASGFSANLDLSSLNGANGFRIEGVSVNDYSGRAVSSAGDVNHDGLADLLVGAWTADNGGGASGSTYVVFGRLPDASVNRVGTAASQALVGGDFNDTLAGADGDDVLWGHGNSDKLLGQGGDDTLIGGGGKDKLNGAGGADTFLFQDASDSHSTHTADLIRNLTAADVIDLSAIDADPDTTGDQAFHIVSHFTHRAGELVLTHKASKPFTLLQGDIDGDGVADIVIKLDGDHHDFANFVF